MEVCILITQIGRQNQWIQLHIEPFCCIFNICITCNANLLLLVFSWPQPTCSSLNDNAGSFASPKFHWTWCIDISKYSMVSIFLLALTGKTDWHDSIIHCNTVMVITFTISLLFCYGCNSHKIVFKMCIQNVLHRI